jgi:hypothetical protein
MELHVVCLGAYRQLSRGSLHKHYTQLDQKKKKPRRGARGAFPVLWGTVMGRQPITCLDTTSRLREDDGSVRGLGHWLSPTGSDQRRAFLSGVCYWHLADIDSDAARGCFQE